MLSLETVLLLILNSVTYLPLPRNPFTVWLKNSKQSERNTFVSLGLLVVHDSGVMITKKCPQMTTWHGCSSAPVGTHYPEEHKAKTTIREVAGSHSGWRRLTVWRFPPCQHCFCLQRCIRTDIRRIYVSWIYFNCLQLFSGACGGCMKEPRPSLLSVCVCLLSVIF